MIFFHALAFSIGLYQFSINSNVVIAQEVEENRSGQMVKMCLFYPSPSGHARTDPIISQTCPSDHVHTFYGPQNFHPNTSNENLRDTAPARSTSPFVENQSLYWHPSIYEVSTSHGSKTYTRVSNLDSSPYYRWDNSVSPRTEEFPKDFRMIAYSNQQGANEGGETGGNLFVECCNVFGDDEEECTSTIGNLEFPKRNCDFLGIAFAMPTCWNGNPGVTNDHISHMAYTTDGTVEGNCPTGYDQRLPQIQLFVRIAPYRGANVDYVLSDESNVFHVDFMNGWQEGKLQQIIDNCPVEGNRESGYNPPCDCDQFLTPNNNLAEESVCENDVRNYIVDEPTDVVSSLPRGTCQGASVVPKSWDVNPPFTCDSSPSPPTAPTPTAPTPTAPTPTAPSPTVVEDECEDSFLPFQIEKSDGSMMWRNCEWVEDDPELRCERFDGVASHCPYTCGLCNECFDGELRFRFYNRKGKRMKKDCAWVEARNTVKRCRIEGIAETCRETCEVC